MNWYKSAQVKEYEPTITSFEERNKLNARVRLFEQICSMLAYLKKYIVQNPPDAQRLAREIAENKITSSFSHLRELLNYAIAKARDNYKEFAQICDVALEKMVLETEKLKERRSKFVNETFPLQIKLWKERAKNE